MALAVVGEVLRGLEMSFTWRAIGLTGEAKEAYYKEQDLSIRALTFENMYKLVRICNT